jgi:hypothetical protein
LRFLQKQYLIYLMNDDQNPLSADEEITDEASSLGSAPEDVEDIDETQESVGLPSDEDGPQELNSAQVIEEADKNQE